MKCVVTGDGRIDTWNLITKYVASPHFLNARGVLGVDIGFLEVVLDNVYVKVGIWDLSPEFRFQYFRPSFYRGAFCVAVFFDLSQERGVERFIRNKLKEASSALEGCPFLFFGCNAEANSDRSNIGKLIQELCDQHREVLYYEIGSDQLEWRFLLTKIINSMLHFIGIKFGPEEAIANSLIPWEEKIRAREAERQRQLDIMKTILAGLGYSVSDNSQVKILNHHGLFIIDLVRGNVNFVPAWCRDCNNSGCFSRIKREKKKLCIISESDGWSNVDLSKENLEVMAKIFAIAEDNLPSSVIRQIKEICPGPIERDLSPDSSKTNRFSRGILSINAESLPRRQGVRDSTASPQNVITPEEARTLLRNCTIRFRQGLLPYSLYLTLKQRYEEILKRG